MGPGNYRFFPLHYSPICLPYYSLFIRKNDINIDKNRYNFRFRNYGTLDHLVRNCIFLLKKYSCLLFL